jgi:hypothetical protein
MLGLGDDMLWACLLTDRLLLSNTSGSIQLRRCYCGLGLGNDWLRACLLSKRLLLSNNRSIRLGRCHCVLWLSKGGFRGLQHDDGLE